MEFGPLELDKDYITYDFVTKHIFDLRVGSQKGAYFNEHIV